MTGKLYYINHKYENNFNWKIYTFKHNSFTNIVFFLYEKTKRFFLSFSSNSAVDDEV